MDLLPLDTHRKLSLRLVGSQCLSALGGEEINPPPLGNRIMGMQLVASHSAGLSQLTDELSCKRILRKV
jgi:hypothetical protein